MNLIIDLFNHYGYLVLLISLTLELIAFPLPGEALMTYCGYIVYTNKMNWTVSILVAASGAITGITISYLIGKILGVGFFEKYGHFVHLDKKRIEKISIWFQSYGSKLLIIAYFIPGVRHVTGYFSGITNISYRKFSVYAYSGALVWTFTFISLGKVLGANWEKYHSLMTRYLVIAGLITAAIIIIIYFYRNYKQKILEWLISTLQNSIRIFNSLGKIKILFAGIAATFLVFSVLVIGIIQDYLANEFGQFDEVIKYLVTHIFDESWMYFMRIFNSLSNNYALLVVILLTMLWISIKGSNKLYEIRFLIISYLGAEGLGILLKNVFHRLGPSGIIYTFPSNEVLISIVIYGFMVYLIIKQSKKTWIKTIITVAYFILCFFVGLSFVYFNIQYPSDIAAGFEFGMVWLSLSIILLEIYRILPKLRN
ncbi:bifunctional DedA family/phosphatase PAP2 family protein [Clostridium sp. YIM B02515]|uniref:Bifunctional DedA family/phosphatase PAP2 family protein n=1 Tax=Clostridium rhizosphaerae TaxID=2803861 RepID=A0ABS1T5D9_9CLOT|nr:VTT domain-containing protein [Clostridium rhizosphaerae]MBL4934540.1 bifunctional DedA family/phosphatase PAP2 family protein [Clostridium rhizosphaerae]